MNNIKLESCDSTEAIVAQFLRDLSRTISTLKQSTHMVAVRNSKPYKPLQKLNLLNKNKIKWNFPYICLAMLRNSCFKATISIFIKITNNLLKRSFTFIKSLEPDMRYYLIIHDYFIHAGLSGKNIPQNLLIFPIAKS